MGDFQIVGRNGDALCAQSVNFFQQCPRVHHHAIADNRQLALAHNARWQERQLIHLAIDNQCVTGIVPALKAGHHVGAHRQPIDDFAFTFVAPLRADHDNMRHLCPLHKCPTDLSATIRTVKIAVV